MKASRNNPKILIVTPEITYLPDGMGYIANYLSAKAGGLADVSATLVSALFELGVDVHVAIPNYRQIFGGQLAYILGKKLRSIKKKMPLERIHLAEDEAFFNINYVYSSYSEENSEIAIAFQREIINKIIPQVKPDFIHCNDWMTGLIPAAAKKLHIPSLFTIHNIYTTKFFLSQIEEMGIDVSSFWQYLYYENMAPDYKKARESNPVDLLTSGVFAADFVNTVSPTFLTEVIKGRHEFVECNFKQEVTNKWNAGCAVGIMNSPDPSFDPGADKDLIRTYGPKDHVAGKRENKRFLQKTLGLVEDDRAPLFFWPSRLDTIQKGCHLLAEILYEIVLSNWEQHLEIVIVSNGDYEINFKNIVKFHHLESRVAVCNFNERLSRLAYGASDFILMPSRFEPCGLPQMIGPIYGSLPVARDTGGIHDTVINMDIQNNTGNGFLFQAFDAENLLTAVKQALRFYNHPEKTKQQQIKRVMKQSATAFNHMATARQYVDTYEKILRRPLIRP